ncbi:Domain often clustered or fused with uracil-DNA glycosylase / Uracil-DNA glycosylase, putative family 6 [plant metagenome]|uniref:Type-4 uracil-DNA glycosylase n=1 Tax=plant metagenome TaxID=1297885 RepID=A0A484PU38_9ZZZZ
MMPAVPPELVVDGGYPQWRRLALQALSHHWPPESLNWVSRLPSAPAALQLSLDTPAETAGGTAMPASVRPRISRDLAALLQDAALFRSAERWAFLYKVLWRWQQGDRSVASPADEDGARLAAMAKAVRRAKHDMIAYVRFRSRGAASPPEYLAWYEPEHDVLPYAAGHFADRMGKSTWCIGTPQGAALWDGQALRLTDTPADAAAWQADTRDDAIEPLWLTYYQSIFNPARLNTTALEQRMPVRFWKGLPEGELIPQMIADARNGAQRTGQASGVGIMAGKPIAVDAHIAQPQRPAPTSLDQCRRCELWRDATQAVPGSGPASARIVVIGEQPGDHEDLAGLPFIGPAGQVLDEALRRAGVARDSLYLTNAVKHFKWEPRGKRRLHKTPAQREVEACAHWLDAELARLRPAVIVTLGATALRAVLGRDAALKDHLGQAIPLDQGWLVATWHPSYALRSGDASAHEACVRDIAHALGRAASLARDGGA